ncbi:MAG: Asp-tRNA(Asn)/Glu-tRNA(Gln) amidotransferase GatCAB subunit B, partial [Gemmatimonadaceae bacterium]|nr:Asp-tRNA(Asn)/Glu-tRNA(Gln) amidotransferase GatCAB subunit B [Gemmatimonadaceae bacterium]
MTTTVSAPAAWEMVVGLEVHVQLRTRTKAFCNCSVEYGAAPNANTCPVCLALPGALPVLNAHAVELATRAALALGCTVNPASVFARKNYFYPDLPKGYQISQFDKPLAEHGRLKIGTTPAGVGISIGITRVH